MVCVCDDESRRDVCVMMSHAMVRVCDDESCHGVL